MRQLLTGACLVPPIALMLSTIIWTTRAEIMKDSSEKHHVLLCEHNTTSTSLYGPQGEVIQHENKLPSMQT
jgi:hypothetical protein